MEVRPATRADIPAIASVFTESWRVAYAGLMPDQLIASLDAGRRVTQLERLFASDMARESMLAAEVDGDVVGTAWTGPDRAHDADAQSGELYAIYVLAEHWDQGVGYALMQAAFDELRSHGFERAVLWVLDGNQRAERFYEQVGWTRDSAMKLEEWGDFQLQEVRYLFSPL